MQPGYQAKAFDFFLPQTPAQFFSHYRTGLSSYQYTYISALAYDAVWTLASALNTSVHLIRSGNDSGCEGESGNLVPWENFTYSNSKMGCILMRALQGTKFYGVSVSVVVLLWDASG